MSQRVLLVGGPNGDRGRAERALTGAGFETDSVADGADAFEQMMALPYDLVVTDCCLERLECSAMLAKLRGVGVRTPIFLWATSEHADKVERLREAAVGYVDRAEPVERLVEQVSVVLRTGESTSPSQRPTSEAPETKPACGGILLIDERKSDAEALLGLVPSGLHVVTCASANEGLAKAHDHKFDLVLFSVDTAITNLTGVLAQMHILLPDAFVIGVVTVAHGQSAQSALKALEGYDFDEAILHPFTAELVKQLIDHYCSPWDELVVVDEDVVRASARCSRREQYKEFAANIRARLEQGVRALIDACFDRVLVDVSAVDRLSPMDLAETLRRLRACARPFGVTVQFVASPPAVATLRKLENTFGWDRFELFPSLGAARGEDA
jgi:DNA-binding response OmpR family regulator